MKIYINGALNRDGTLRDNWQTTVPPYFDYINTSYLFRKGYKSKFFDNSGYFTTYGGNGEDNKKAILSCVFTKGNINIWFGLWYEGCPPMLITIRINGHLIYEA